jgi:negative regulator of replication initiation
MKQIEIDDEVYAVLVKRVTDFNQKPNDILRDVLGLNKSSVSAKPESEAVEKSPLLNFVNSSQYRSRKSGIEKYLLILGWLYKSQPERFKKLADEYQRGKRVYFAREPKQIAESGQGITIKQIPGTPYHTLATLDNRQKRIIIGDVMAELGYSSEICSQVSGTIEDSNIKRSHSRKLLAQLLSEEKL